MLSIKTPQIHVDNNLPSKDLYITARRRGLTNLARMKGCNFDNPFSEQPQSSVAYSNGDLAMTSPK